MTIQSVSTSNDALLKLFYAHDDYMIEFLGEDQRFYTRYSENEKLSRIWGAYVNDRLIGCIAYREMMDGTGEVKRLFVQEIFRGRGISKELLHTVEEYAREQGCRELVLDTRVTLEPAVTLYRKFGFQIVFQQGLYIQMKKALQ